MKKKDLIIVISAIIGGLLIFAALLFGVFNLVQKSFTSCEPYKHSIELIQNDSELMDYLGTDFKRKGIVSGSISTNGNLTGKATFSYKIEGKNGISVVYIDASKENGVWEYQKINFYKKVNSNDLINLLQN